MHFQPHPVQNSHFVCLYCIVDLMSLKINPTYLYSLILYLTPKTVVMNTVLITLVGLNKNYSDLGKNHKRNKKKSGELAT